MRLKSIKEAVLRKGWAGRTLSCADTAARLNPLLRDHVALNRAYDRAADTCPDAHIAEKLTGLQKKARVDVGKLSETVLSCGAPAYSGVEREPEEVLHTSLLDVADLERAFGEALEHERKLEHQMRTQAVLQRLVRHSEERLEFARGAVRHLRLRRGA